MDEAANVTLCSNRASEIDSPERRRWVSWLHWLNQTLACDPTEETALQLVRDYVQRQGQPKDRRIRDWVRKAFDSIGMRYTKATGGLGHGLFYLEKVVESPPDPGLFPIDPVQDRQIVWERPVAEIHDGGWLSCRRTAAHELGHVVLFSLLSSETEALSKEFRERYSTVDSAEDFCERFAYLATTTNEQASAQLWAAVEEKMATENYKQTRREAELVQEASQLRITFQHLCTLAGMKGISIRHTIAWLDQSDALGTAECAITVLRVFVHPQPKRTEHSGATLRVWQRAVPPWGFLPRHRRAVTSGFRRAPEAFDKVEDRKTWSTEEELSVAEDCKLLGVSSRTKFRWRKLQTPCAYIPVDVTNEGRYLIAIWRWALPLS